MINTRSLEQSILMTLVNGGLDVTNKDVLQRAVIELRLQDFTDMVDKDLFQLVSKRIRDGEIYYAFELLGDTTHQDVQSRIELYIHLAASGLNFTGLDGNILKLKKYNKLKSAMTYLNNINRSLQDTSDIEQLEKIFFDNLSAINNIESIQDKKSSDVHALVSQDAYDETNKKYYYQTTFRDLNKSLGHKGIREGSLCVIAGASGVGKSSFSLFMLDSIASLQAEKQSLFFSLELDKTELMERYLGVLAKTPYSQMSSEQLEKARILAFERPNIKVYDLIDYPDIKYISTIIRHSILASYNKPISVIVIDFIGLVKIEAYRESKAQMLEDIAYQLLSLGKKLGCVIILLQQVNREYYKREGSDIVPFCQDASDSSGPEKAASLWIGIGRHGEHDNHDPNHFEAVIRKNRHGEKDFRISLEFANGTFRQLDKGFQFRRISKKQDDYFVSQL